jgi:soluble lytic murein transglycosylase-like protein
MSILSALKETQHANNNLDDLAKLPQALIMQMAQNGQIPKDMVMPILGKKAEMVETAAKMKAAQGLAAQGGAQPTIMEQYMGQIAQAENPAPPMPQQQMQQPMSQQTAQQPMPQGPEDVGIATQATQPMSLAGGGIIAFEGGGDVDSDEDYQEAQDDAYETAMNNKLFAMIANSKGRDSTENRGVGIRAESRGAERGMEGKGDLESRLRAIIMQRESGGRDYDQKGNPLTSSKGAKYAMQVLDSTAKDPGFGIKPAKDISAPEYNRVGNEYIGALYNKYQDPKLTMIAYNMGPGATDKWLAAGADPRKLPKETQGYIRGVNLAQGGEVKHYDIGGEIDTTGAELDALRSGTDSLYQELMRGGSRGGSKSPELQAAYENALALRKQKEAEYEALMTKGGVNKPSFFPQSSLSSKRPEANPIVKREAVGAPPVVKSAQNKTSPEEVEQFFSRFDTIPTKGNIPQNAAGIVNLKKDKEDKEFNMMDYIKAREAKMDKAAEKDMALAGLAAGLGILGGTSQYAFENIGKGGQMGVQQLATSQKTRAAQEAALGKLYGSAAQTDLMNKMRKDQLAENTRQFDERQGLAANSKLNEAIQKALGAKQNQLQMNKLTMLEGQLSGGKELAPEKLKELQDLRTWRAKIENDVRREYSTSSGGGGYTPTQSQAAALNRYSS